MNEMFPCIIYIGLTSERIHIYKVCKLLNIIAIFRTACLLEAMNAYFDAIEDDFLNWRSEVLRAVVTDVTVLKRQQERNAAEYGR